MDLKLSHTHTHTHTHRDTHTDTHKHRHAQTQTHTQTLTHRHPHTLPLTGCTGITAVGTGDEALRGTPGGKETAIGLGNTAKLSIKVSNEGLCPLATKALASILPQLKHHT